jgi:hypothetical protein
MHGGRGGAPWKNKNAQKHGALAAEARCLAKHVRDLARIARNTMKAIE